MRVAGREIVLETASRDLGRRIVSWLEREACLAICAT